MADALNELEQVLRSQKEKLTAQEENVLATCKSKAVRQFTFSMLFGGSFMWAATWNLSKLARVNLSAGAAMVLGLWKFNRSTNSCVDHILALDGTRMQAELAKIMAEKYWGDRWEMQRLHRHFYVERVFNDSSLDNLTLRLRYRNVFNDNGTLGQSTHENDFDDVSHDDSNSKKTCARSSSKKTSVGSNQVLMHPGGDVMEDPLDIIFGYLAPVEEIHRLKTPSASDRIHGRKQKRSHRRHRMHHNEVSSKLEC